jgi:hypothetical protein
MTLRLFSVATVFVAVVLLATLVIPEAIAHASANEGDFSGLLGSSEASRIIDNAYQRYLAGRKHLKRSVDSFDPIPPKAHQCSAEAVAREQKDLFERESAGKDLSQVFRALEKVCNYTILHGGRALSFFSPPANLVQSNDASQK